jgi:hypothetical protein
MHAYLPWLTPQREIAIGLGLQRCRLETFDLDDNLAASRRPHTEMHAAAGLQLGANRQAPDGRRFGRGQMFRNGKIGRCQGHLSLLREADACVHAAISRSPYASLPCVRGCPTVPVVMLSSPATSDGTRSGRFIATVDCATLRMAVAI